MYLDWNDEKDAWLKKVRGIGFEEIVESIGKGKVIDIRAHHNRNKYPSQVELIVEVDKYVYVVPCVVEDDKWFLKTIIPNRKELKKYLKKEKDEK